LDSAPAAAKTAIPSERRFDAGLTAAEKTRETMRPLVWFRSDLRVRDNPALYHAARDASRGVVAVFIITPVQWTEHDWGDNKVEFVIRNLKALSSELEKLAIGLLVERVDDFHGAPERLLRIAKRHRCDAMYFNREYEVNERRRDERVLADFGRAEIPVHSFADQTVIQPGELLTKTGGYYSVYGPFRRRFLEAIRGSEVLEVLPRARRQEGPVCKPGRIPNRIQGFSRADWVTAKWPEGEGAARSRLKRFLGEGAEGYRANRDLPDVEGTSRLSPYLALGVLSAREALANAIAANHGRCEGGNAGLSTWIAQLIWREFYRHVLFGFPRVSMSRPFRPEGDFILWRYEEDEFKAWCDGHTGIPIVDAGMRQLNETGWMHNRLRMITAMFLAKHLLIDWQLGERHFMQHLVDADLANNNGGWQWSASTGTDAAPYFRIFNPWVQGRRFDPEGDFIRRFVPELRNVRAADLHDPGRMRDLPRAALDYPLPMVEHRAARDRAIRVFKAALGSGKR
jgi:deoxyribodipyrimidine photo-lyase